MVEQAKASDQFHAKDKRTVKSDGENKFVDTNHTEIQFLHEDVQLKGKKFKSAQASVF